MSDWREVKKWHQWTDHGFGVEVVCHGEREPASEYAFPRQWNTYLNFSDKLKFSKGGELCEPYAEPCPLVEYLWNNREALNRLEGWNGGPTFHEFLTDDNGCRRIKIGDDFQHLWDFEYGRYKMYNLDYMQRAVLRTAAEAAELLRFLQSPNALVSKESE